MDGWRFWKLGEEDGVGFGDFGGGIWLGRLWGVSIQVLKFRWTFVGLENGNGILMNYLIDIGWVMG